MGAIEDARYSRGSVQLGRLLMVAGAVIGAGLACVAMGEIWPLVLVGVGLGWDVYDNVTSTSEVEPRLLGALYGLAYLGAGVACFFVDPLLFVSLAVLITIYLDDLIEGIMSD